jgi:thioredoxin-like negative regulator of GroEL
MPTLDDGRQAIEQGNLQQARLIFEAILQETPRSEEAWLGLAEVLTDAEDKRICYENALKINKNSRAAREGLRNLEPQADPLIAALQQQTASREEEEGFPEDETMISTRDALSVREEAPPETGDGPPTIALVAIGLLLSVVIFAIGSGTVFFLITSLTGP